MKMRRVIMARMLSRALLCGEPVDWAAADVTGAYARGNHA